MVCSLFLGIAGFRSSAVVTESVNKSYQVTVASTRCKKEKGFEGTKARTKTCESTPDGRLVTGFRAKLMV